MSSFPGNFSPGLLSRSWCIATSAFAMEEVVYLMSNYCMFIYTELLMWISATLILSTQQSPLLVMTTEVLFSYVNVLCKAPRIPLVYKMWYANKLLAFAIQDPGSRIRFDDWNAKAHSSIGNLAENNNMWAAMYTQWSEKENEGHECWQMTIRWWLLQAQGD